MNGYNNKSDAIKALGSTERIALLESLAAQLFKTDRWSGLAGRLLDLQPRTVANWRSGTNDVPVYVLLLFQTIVEAEKLKSFHKGYTDLQALAAQLGD